MFRKVLDIDFTSKYSNKPILGKDHIIKIFSKLLLCKNFDHLKFFWSSFKGCHIILFCKKNCDICRMCYDDDKHFNFDEKRPEYARNIVFDKKEKVKIKIDS